MHCFIELLRVRVQCDAHTRVTHDLRHPNRIETKTEDQMGHERPAQVVRRDLGGAWRVEALSRGRKSRSGHSVSRLMRAS
jgi:hypothetical protein